MLPKVPSKYRAQVIEAAQQALTEYLHTTRSLPFTYAEHISRYSKCSLYDVVSKVGYSSLTSFPKSLQRFLRYHPVNEFEFFYESIGIDYADVNKFLHPQNFFITEDSRGFDVACALSGFGFPWNSLGKLYKEEISIFSRDPDDLSKNLHGFKKYGFSSVKIIGICLVFPFIIGGDPNLAGEIDSLLDCLQRLLVDTDLVNCVESTVQAWVDVCKKVRVFYDLGSRKEKIAEFIGKNKHFFLDYKEGVLVYNSRFFLRLGIDKNDVGLLLLERPEIFDIDLEHPVISISELLIHFGLDQIKLESISQEYPYVLGRNKMSNLPEVMRAMNLQEWFFEQMRNGNHCLMYSYVLGSSNEDTNDNYTNFLVKVQSSRTPIHTLGKLNFLHEIGFGENDLTLAALRHLHGTSKELRGRFDCLLRAGVHYSKLCRIVKISPKILNQNRKTLEKKIKFLLEETDFSLEYLDVFPAFLCFDLDARVKPRHSFHLWLIEKGLSAKRYSLASMVATSEKKFLARIYGIHPAAVKHWFECFSSQINS